MPKSNILKNKKIILTGAAGILGAALTKRYLDMGADIALLDINEAGLDKLQKNLIQFQNQKILYYTLDLTNPEEVDQTVKSIFKEFSVIDVLHNNAATKGDDLKKFFYSYEDYDPLTWKELAGWAPSEDSIKAKDYFFNLSKSIEENTTQ